MLLKLKVNLASLIVIKKKKKKNTDTDTRIKIIRAKQSVITLLKPLNFLYYIAVFYLLFNIIILKLLIF